MEFMQKSAAYLDNSPYVLAWALSAAFRQGAAWDGYSNHRKAPRTRKAGPGFADPDYELSVDWIATRAAIQQAQREHEDPDQPPCILIVNGSSRSEHTCPGEMSKSWRLLQIAREICGTDGTLVRVLDLSRLVAGNVLTAALADLGADVVKVEVPGRGDELRAWRTEGVSTHWKAYARGKRSLAIDLRSARGKALLLSP